MSMSEKKTTAVDAYVGAQFRSWEQNKQIVQSDRERLVVDRVPMPFVTISREYGCGGFEIAERVVTIINEELSPPRVWAAYDRKILERVVSDMGLSERLAETLSNTARTTMNSFIGHALGGLPSQVEVYRRLVEIVRTLAANGHVIVVGRAGNAITRDMENGLHVKIVASMEWKTARMAALLGVKAREAERIIVEKGTEREEFLKNMVQFDSDNPYNFHLIINNSTMSVDEAARLVIAAMRAKGQLPR